MQFENVSKETLSRFSKKVFPPIPVWLQQFAHRLVAFPFGPSVGSCRFFQEFRRNRGFHAKCAPLKISFFSKVMSHGSLREGNQVNTKSRKHMKSEFLATWKRGKYATGAAEHSGFPGDQVRMKTGSLS